MINRAKYFQQLASSIDNSFTRIASTASELYTKEASSIASLRLSEVNTQLTNGINQIVGDPAVSPDEMESRYNNIWQDLQSFSVDGVTNSKAKEIISERTQLMFEDKKAGILLASAQRRAENIQTATKTNLQAMLDGYSPTDRPEDVINKAAAELGYEAGKLINNKFGQQETEALMAAFTRDVNIADGEFSIEALLKSDKPIGSNQGGLDAALQYIEENPLGLNEKDKKYLQNYANNTFSSMNQQRGNIAADYKQRAYDQFMPVLLNYEQTGAYLSEEEVIEFFSQAEYPQDIIDEQALWINTVWSHEDRLAVNNIYDRYNKGEQITIEDITALHNPLLISETDRALLIQRPREQVEAAAEEPLPEEVAPEEPATTEELPEPEPVAEATPAATSGRAAQIMSVAGPQATTTSRDPITGPVIYGYDKSNPSLKVELDSAFRNPQIGDDQFHRMVMQNQGELSTSDMKTFTGDRSFIQDPSYVLAEELLKERFSSYYKASERTISQGYAESHLLSMVANAFRQDPQLVENPTEFMGYVDQLFEKEFVQKNISKDFSKMVDLRNGGKSFERDLKNTDSAEQFMADLWTGKYDGMFSMSLVGEYLADGRDMTFDDMADFYADKFWGVPYNEVTSDNLRKNITDVTIAYTSILKATKETFETEIAPFLNGKDVVSMPTDKGMVFVDSDGIAYRAGVFSQGRGMAEIWTRASVGKEYYNQVKTGVRGESVPPLPGNVHWEEGGLTERYALHVIAESDREKADRVEARRQKIENLTTPPPSMTPEEARENAIYKAAEIPGSGVTRGELEEAQRTQTNWNNILPPQPSGSGELLEGETTPILDEIISGIEPERTEALQKHLGPIASEIVVSRSQPIKVADDLAEQWAQRAEKFFVDTIAGNAIDLWDRVTNPERWAEEANKRAEASEKRLAELDAGITQREEALKDGETIDAVTEYYEQMYRLQTESLQRQINQ